MVREEKENRLLCGDKTGAWLWFLGPQLDTWRGQICGDGGDVERGRVNVFFSDCSVLIPRQSSSNLRT